jgi:hypothetical protein
LLADRCLLPSHIVLGGRVVPGDVFSWSNREFRRRRLSRFSGLLSLFIVVFAGGCGGDYEAPTKACGAIVGGKRDLTHNAVVALTDLEGDLVCSATLVGRIAGNAVFLSAAHCLANSPTHIAVGSDYHSPAASLPIVGEIEHPQFDYATGDYDFVLLVGDNGLDDLAAIEVARKDDGLSVGSELRFVGFGEDEAGTQNSLRRAVTGIVDELTPLSLEYEQALGGPCSGDSGGPAIVSRAGHDLLVGVTSFGERGCGSRGTSARVASASEFILAELELPTTECP